MKKRFKYEITPVPGHVLKEFGYIEADDLEQAWVGARMIASAMAPMARVDAINEVSINEESGNGKGQAAERQL